MKKITKKSEVPARLTLTNIRNEKRRVEKIKFDDPRVSLQRAAQLQIVFRGEDGTLWSNARGGGGEFAQHQNPKGGGPLPPIVTLEMEAKGTWAEDVELYIYEFNKRYDIAGRKPYAVSFVSCWLKLRSNTVFVNGEFDLPANYDPFADVETFRIAEEKRDQEWAEKQKKAKERLQEEPLPPVTTKPLPGSG